MLRLLSTSLLLKPFRLLTHAIEQRASFTFSVAFLTSMGGFFIAAYITTFLVATISFSSPSIRNSFILLFIVFCFFVYALGYYAHFGLFSRFGVKPFTARLRLIDQYMESGSISFPDDEDVSIDLLRAMERLPVENIQAAFIYPTLVMVAVVVQQLVIGSARNALLMTIGIASAIIIYVFFTYVVAELLSGAYRVRVKEYLTSRGISFKEKALLSIKQKFILLTILVFIAMIELGLMFYFATMQGQVLMPALFIIFTSVLIGSLLFLYQLSIESSLREIEKAALDLGRGGTGKLFIAGLDSELLNAGRGFMSAAYEVNDLRDNLEKKVEARTEELNNTINKMEELQKQQAGDYFLTSLLTEPLMANEASGVNVKVEFYLKQKKEFVFRKWDKELGGDICMSHNFFIRGKLYTVFINADAMGKSMQGAGGVLVLGSGFRAIVNRTRFSSMEQNTSPEEWLRNAHLELHRLFEGFNGSMLMSMVMGLVEDETGMVYFINAEHPWTVLYRDGKASFLEKELNLWKLGVEQDLKAVQVRTFRMKHGDAIIAGSDGRDDILLPTGPDGTPVMNEDERLFLKMVEQNRGDIDSVAQMIMDKGVVTDDLSLLKVTFTGKDPGEGEDPECPVEEILENAQSLYDMGRAGEAVVLLEEKVDQCPGNRKLIRRLVKYLVAMKEYSRALELASDYIDANPEDTEYHYVMSYCLQKMDNLEAAARLALRSHIRQPENSRYALHLTQVYIDMKNYLEADQLLDLVLANDPQNAKAIKMKDMM